MTNQKSKIKKTQVLQELDRRYIWHPFTQMQDWIEEDPLIIESGQGSYLYDTDGNRYLDGVSSLWVNVHGHAHPSLNAALQRQLKKVAHSTLLGLGNVPSIELAQALVAVAPRGLTKVFYSDNGSTAVEIALKMAYQYWQHQEPQSRRKRFMTFSEAYHGDTLGAVSVGGIDLFHKIYAPFLFDVIRLPSPYFFKEEDGCEKLIQLMEKALREHKGEFIGIVMEPLIQGAAGMLTHPRGFLKKVREFCDRHDLLLILDEVATGFGRTGQMFACQHENVAPDLMAIAKGITAGYLPLAATLVKEKIYRAFLGKYSQFKTFFHGHTYTGNPLACAVALESLKLFKKRQLLRQIQSRIKELEKGLKVFERLEHVGEIRQCGLMAGIHLVEGKGMGKVYPLERKIGIRVCRTIRKYGVILRPLGNVIVLMPPLAISCTELKDLLSATYQAIEEVTAEG